MCFMCKRSWHGSTDCADAPFNVYRSAQLRISLKTHQIDRSAVVSERDQTEELSAKDSLCPLCHSRNKGPVLKGGKRSVEHTCFFCHYTYCACCGEDASAQANHFGFFSETNCGFNRQGVCTREDLFAQENCCKKIMKNIGLALLAIVAYPFFLVFFPLFIVPYVLQGRFESTLAKTLAVLLGLIQGALLIPFFVVAALLYTLVFLVAELLACCGFEECDFCCCYPSVGYNPTSASQAQEEAAFKKTKLLRQLRSKNRQRALARISMLCDP